MLNIGEVLIWQIPANLPNHQIKTLAKFSRSTVLTLFLHLVPGTTADSVSIATAAEDKEREEEEEESYSHHRHRGNQRCPIDSVTVL